MSALLPGKNEVVVTVSQSGQTSALLQCVSLAMEAGATTIGRTPQGTPLSQQSSIPISVNMEEDHPAFCTGILSHCAYGGNRCVGYGSGAKQETPVKRTPQPLAQEPEGIA